MKPTAKLFLCSVLLNLHSLAFAGGTTDKPCLVESPVNLYEGELGTYAKDGNTEISVGKVTLISTIHNCGKSGIWERIQADVALNQEIPEHEIDFSKLIVEVDTYASFDLSLNTFTSLGKGNFEIQLSSHAKNANDHQMRIVKKGIDHIWLQSGLLGQGSTFILDAALNPKAIEEGKRPLACSLEAAFIMLNLKINERVLSVSPLRSIDEIAYPDFCHD